MLILGALLVAVVLAWLQLSPIILPQPEAQPSATDLDGEWTLYMDEPLATTFALSGSSYRFEGALDFNGAGRAGRDGDDLLLADDAACPDTDGRYAIELGDIDRGGAEFEDRVQTMTLTLVSDACVVRADTLVSSTWVLRASGRDGVHGICDPPDESPGLTSLWPRPTGCA
jgi:hypothetical protein